MDWTSFDYHPDDHKLEQFGIAGCALLVLLAATHGASAGWQSRDGLLLLAGGGLGLTAISNPRRLRWLFVAASATVWPIGWLVSRLLVGVILYGMLTPLAAFFRLRGRDTLAVKRRQVDTYWTPKPTPAERQRYFRQY